MLLSQVKPLAEAVQARALVMPATTNANHAVIDSMESAGYYTEDEGDFIVTVEQDRQFVYICKSHETDQYMVGSWWKKENDFGNHPFEGTLYDCVQYFNQNYNTNFQVKQ